MGIQMKYPDMSVSNHNEITADRNLGGDSI